MKKLNSKIQENEEGNKKCQQNPGILLTLSVICYCSERI